MSSPSEDSGDEFMEGSSSDEDSNEEQDESDLLDSEAEEVSDEDIETSSATEEEDDVTSETLSSPLKRRRSLAQEDKGSDDGEGSLDLSKDLQQPSTSRRPPATKKKRTLVESSSSEEDDNSSPVRKVKRSGKQTLLSSSSEDEATTRMDGSESDDSKEVCAICLLKIGNQELGRPTVCNHVFCSDCIVEWSRNVATCPIDRLSMRSIRITLGNVLVRDYRVKVRRMQEIEEDLLNDVPIFDTTCFCEMCRSGDREERLLLCDGCDLAYHMECLTPALNNIPRGRWYCPTCEEAGVGVNRLILEVNRRQVRRRLIRAVPDLEGSEVEDDLDGFIVPDDSDAETDLDDEPEVMPRTMRTERIQRTVQLMRRTKVVRKKRSTSKKKGGKKIKRRKTKKKTTKSKSTTEKKSTSKSTTEKKSTKKKRKTKRRKVLKGKKGKGKGTKKRKAKEKASKDKKTEKEERVSHDIGPLSIFGDKNDLDFFGDEEPFIVDPGPSTSGWTMSRDKAAQLIKNGNRSSTRSDFSDGSERPVDLLTNIIASQKKVFQQDSSSSQSQKMKEVYSRSSDQVVATPSKTISTSVTKYIHDQKQKEKVTSKKVKVVEEKRCMVQSVITFEETSITRCTETVQKQTIQYGSKRCPEESATPLPPVQKRPRLEEKSDRNYEHRLNKLTAIGVVAKQFLKPYFVDARITKEQYKKILKCSVEKIYKQDPENVYPEKVKKLVASYVEYETSK